jgi:hypothetical protein
VLFFMFCNSMFLIQADLLILLWLYLEALHNDDEYNGFRTGGDNPQS